MKSSVKLFFFQNKRSEIVSKLLWKFALQSYLLFGSYTVRLMTKMGVTWLWWEYPPRWFWNWYHLEVRKGYSTPSVVTVKLENWESCSAISYFFLLNVEHTLCLTVGQHRDSPSWSTRSISNVSQIFSVLFSRFWFFRSENWKLNVSFESLELMMEVRAEGCLLENNWSTICIKREYHHPQL